MKLIAHLILLAFNFSALNSYSETINLQSGNSITIGSTIVQCNFANPIDEKPLFCRDDYIINKSTGQQLAYLGANCILKTTGWVFCDNSVIKGQAGLPIGSSTANEMTCLNSIKGKFACNDRNLYNFEGKLLFENVTFSDCVSSHKESTYCYGVSLKNWTGDHIEQYSTGFDCLAHMY